MKPTTQLLNFIFNNIKLPDRTGVDYITKSLYVDFYDDNQKKIVLSFLINIHDSKVAITTLIKNSTKTTTDVNISIYDLPAFARANELVSKLETWKAS